MSGVYVVEDDGRLLELLEQPYDSEALLQELLANHPSLLAGEQIGTEARRWILVSREAGVASEDGGSPRWSVDHVFIDQEAIPTLVEVKRSPDTRIRREVVGQMLDYAANAVVYWPVQTMREAFEATCAARSVDPAVVLAGAIGEQAPEDFWEAVGTNLRAGRIRMIFVSDVISPELQRIVEFMNEQFATAEVLAVEVRQFVGGGRKTLVPRVIGRTAAAQRAKATGRPSRAWDEESFFAELEAQKGESQVTTARAIYERSQVLFPRIAWGKGQTYGVFYPCFDYGAHAYWLFGLWTNGLVEIAFKPLASRPPFDSDDMRLELRRRLNEIEGVALPETAIARYPNISLPLISEESELSKLVAALEWMHAEITRA